MSPFAAPDAQRGPSHGLVVLFGWLGADPHHVDKYAALWRALGWDTHVVVFDTASCFTLSAAKRSFFAQADALLAALASRAAAGASTRLVMHAFSNTGWLAYARFVQLLAAARAPVAGALLDSCPHPTPSTKVWAAGFVTALRPNKPPAPKSAYFRATRLLMRAWLGWGTRRREITDVAADEAALARFDQTYVFSTNDHVIPAASVRAVVAARRARGVAVEAVELADSPHVQHLRRHRAPYAAAVAGLHARVLASSPPAAAAPPRAARVLAALDAGRKPSLGRSLSLSALGRPPSAAAAAHGLSASAAPKVSAGVAHRASKAGGRPGGLPPRHGGGGGGLIVAAESTPPPAAHGGVDGLSMSPMRSQSLGALMLTRLVS